MCNFADDNTLCSCAHDVKDIVTNLESDLCKVFRWFASNGMVANPENFQIMFLGMKTNRRLPLNIEGKKLPATDQVKLLGNEIDSKLTFIKHVEALCHTVNKKITASSGLTNFISTQQAQAIHNMIILSSFNYYLLIWMLCNKSANKIDYESLLEALLTRNGSNSIHATNLQKLMRDTFKSMNELNPHFYGSFMQGNLLLII